MTDLDLDSKSDLITSLILISTPVDLKFAFCRAAAARSASEGARVSSTAFSISSKSVSNSIPGISAIRFG